MAGHRNPKSSLTSQQIEALSALLRQMFEDATLPLYADDAQVDRFEPYVMLMSDVCDALGCSSEQRFQIMGAPACDLFSWLTEPNFTPEPTDPDYITIGRNSVPVLGTIGAGGKVDLSPFGEAVLHLWSVDGK